MIIVVAALVDQWSRQQKAANDAAAPVIRAFADDIERIGRRGNNPTMQDFATFAAQYQRALVKSPPSHQPRDAQLGKAAHYLRTMLVNACAALQGIASRSAGPLRRQTTLVI